MTKVKSLLARWFPNYTCMACGAEMATATNRYLCDRCQAELPLIDQAATHYAPFAYAEPVRSMILRLKYSSNGFIAKALVPYLAAVYFREELTADLIVPVPLYRRRQRWRGYNQSSVLANELASYLQLPVVAALDRVKPTVAQKHMDTAARQANVARAFLVSDPAAVRQQKILLLDDVYTSGATTQECRRVLLAAGAREVIILTLAIAGL